jgi:hypothetical protein
MMKQGPKEALKEAKSGTPVAEKNFNSKKKEAKAAGSNTASAKKGSMTVALALPMATDDGGKYEGSYKDSAEDYHAAKRKGISSDDWENSARDRVADQAGEKRMRDDESAKVHDAPRHTPGVSAFANRPKASHGFGHPAHARDGHLRNSGHSGAHRLGKK